MSKPDRLKIYEKQSLRLIGSLLGTYGRAHLKTLIVALACMATVSGTTAFSAWLMRDVIDKVFLAKDMAAIWSLAGVIVAIYVVKGFATFGQQLGLSRIGNAVSAGVQRRLYAHVLEMDVPYFADRHTSEFLQLQNFIAGACTQALNTVVVSFGRDLLSLIGLLLVMILQDPLMSLIGLTVMPVAVLGVQKLVKRARAYTHSSYTQVVRGGEITQETVRGIRVVKSFALEDYFVERIEETIAEAQRLSNKLASVGARTAPLMETLGGLAVAGIKIGRAHV